jgi:hypothetical protein
VAARPGGKSLGFLLAVGLAAAGVSPVGADELSDLNQRIVADPTNTELNLQYAMIAEGQKKYRFALAAYERILANDPDNAAAKRGLQRVRRQLQPDTKRITLEAGLGYETNPLQEADNGEGGMFGFVGGRVRDERNIAGTRWRTDLNIFADAYPDEDLDDLNYAVLSGNIGPLYDIPGSMVTMYPAIGGAVTSLSGRYYYSEVNVSATFEGYLEGAYQWARIRGGYRDYDASWTADSGFYVDASGKWTQPDIFSERDAFSIAPWIRWSEMDGSIVESVTNEQSPGRYVGGGARFQYDQALADWLGLGLFVDISDRLYTTDIAPNGDKRNDFLVSPGVTVLFSNVFGRQTALRVDYAWRHNESNDPDADYDNHIVKMTVSKRM